MTLVIVWTTWRRVFLPAWVRFLEDDGLIIRESRSGCKGRPILLWPELIARSKSAD